ncbi:unnamed protein product, partial [Ectocarpus sp. 12 AP-2014]
EGGKGTSSLLPRGPGPSPRNKESPGRKRASGTKSYRNMGARRRCREGVTICAIAVGILTLCSASLITGTGITSVRARGDASFPPGRGG